MNEPVISILIISHGHDDCLPRCLSSLGNALAGLSAEILLLDNLGGELALQVPAMSCPIRFFSNTSPAGFASNANYLTKQASARYVLLLNPDTEYAQGKISDALDWLESHPDTGILGCCLLNEDGSQQHSYRRFPSLAVALLRGLGVDHWPWRPAFYRSRMMSDQIPSASTTVDWVYGAFLLYRRTQYLDLGGMDPAFRLYYEDVDLAKRYQTANLKVIYFPSLVFYHIHLRISARRPLGRAWRWHVLSAWRYFKLYGYW